MSTTMLIPAAPQSCLQGSVWPMQQTCLWMQNAHSYGPNHSVMFVQSSVLIRSIYVDDMCPLRKTCWKIGHNMQMNSARRICRASLSCPGQRNHFHGIQDHLHLNHPAAKHPSILPSGHQLSTLQETGGCLSRQLQTRIKTKKCCCQALPWAPLLVRQVKVQVQGRASVLRLLPGLLRPICCQKAGSLAFWALHRGHLRKPPRCRINSRCVVVMLSYWLQLQPACHRTWLRGLF